MPLSTYVENIKLKSCIDLCVINIYPKWEDCKQNLAKKKKLLSEVKLNRIKNYQFIE